MEDLKAQDAPEAMVYLKLLGAELGYLDTKDGKMIHNLLKMIPTDVSTALPTTAVIIWIKSAELVMHFLQQHQNHN